MASTTFENATLRLLIEDEDGIVTTASLEQTDNGGSGTPGGSDTQIQFNDNNVFGGSSNLTWDGTQIIVTHEDVAPDNDWSPVRGVYAGTGFSGAAFQTYVSGGTIDSKTVPADGQIIGGVEGWAWTGSAYDFAGQCYFKKAGAVAGGHVPAYMQIGWYDYTGSGHYAFFGSTSTNHPYLWLEETGADGIIALTADAEFSFLNSSEALSGTIKAASATLSQLLALTPTADPPGSPTEGMIYADTDHHLYYYNGTTWKQLDN